MNRLSLARLFLFGARDVWFVVGVPVYFQSVLSDGSVLLAGRVLLFGVFVAAIAIAYLAFRAVSRNLIRVAEANLGVKTALDQVSDKLRGLDGGADDFLEVDLGLGGEFAGDDDVVALDQGLAGDAGEAVLREAGVEDRVGDAVGDLVRVSLPDGFGGEGIGSVACHGT